MKNVRKDREFARSVAERVAQGCPPDLAEQLASVEFYGGDELKIDAHGNRIPLFPPYHSANAT